MFNLVSKHTAVYEIRARLNYFESGHGKEPCDGLWGTIKRMADETVKRGATMIQDPKEFFDWSINSNIKRGSFSS